MLVWKLMCWWWRIVSFWWEREMKFASLKTLREVLCDIKIRNAHLIRVSRAAADDDIEGQWNGVAKLYLRARGVPERNWDETSGARGPGFNSQNSPNSFLHPALHWLSSGGVHWCDRPILPELFWWASFFFGERAIFAMPSATGTRTRVARVRAAIAEMNSEFQNLLTKSSSSFTYCKRRSLLFWQWQSRKCSLVPATPRSGIEPGSSAWQAEILTTFLPRTWLKRVHEETS